MVDRLPPEYYRVDGFETIALRRRVAELEAENAKLRAAQARARRHPRRRPRR